MSRGICTCGRMETVTKPCSKCNGMGLVSGHVCWVCGGTRVVKTKATNPACRMHGSHGSSGGCEKETGS